MELREALHAEWTKLRTVPSTAWLLLTVLQLLSYNVLIGYGILGQFKFDPFLQWLVYVPFYALLIGRWLIDRKARAS